MRTPSPSRKTTQRPRPSRRPFSASSHVPAKSIRRRKQTDDPVLSLFNGPSLAPNNDHTARPDARNRVNQRSCSPPGATASKLLRESQKISCLGCCKDPPHFFPNSLLRPIRTKTPQNRRLKLPRNQIHLPRRRELLLPRHYSITFGSSSMGSPKFIVERDPGLSRLKHSLEHSLDPQPIRRAEKH